MSNDPYRALYDAAYNVIAEMHDDSSPQFKTAKDKFQELINNPERFDMVVQLIFTGAARGLTGK